MEIGRRELRAPIPPIPENTTWFPAGAVTFGVEYRVLDEELLESFHQDPSFETQVTHDESGVSIHVSGTEGGEEYLRFDCFDEAPHYHYIIPEEQHQLWVPFDTAANGPALAWTLTCLRERLGPMLRQAGADDLAESYDVAVVNAVLDDVERAARSSTVPAP